MRTIHNPDQYMSDLRQILAQGRKRLGFMLGAGAPASILVDPSTKKLSRTGQPLIPTIGALTDRVISELNSKQRSIVETLKKDLGGNPNIEQILSRVRMLVDAIGSHPFAGMDGAGFREIETNICTNIGKIVSVELPRAQTPYAELVGWIGGTARDHPVEVFTPNYDLLIEEAFERAHIPYFDGFSGSHEPFFDPATIASSDLPTRWARLWKLHGSIGWDENDDGEIIRGKGRNATRLIYPTHLKYDQTQKLPYSALIDRLRKFLQSADSLLMASGFSFNDAHLSAVIDEALASNRSAAVIALQYNPLDTESSACKLGKRRANMSVYARDGAVINCIAAPWQPGDLPHPAWGPIRTSFWDVPADQTTACFLLGDFAAFARYVALTRADHAPSEQWVPSEVTKK